MVLGTISIGEAMALPHASAEGTCPVKLVCSWPGLLSGEFSSELLQPANGCPGPEGGFKVWPALLIHQLELWAVSMLGIRIMPSAPSLCWKVGLLPMMKTPLIMLAAVGAGTRGIVLLLQVVPCTMLSAFATVSILLGLFKYSEIAVGTPSVSKTIVLSLVSVPLLSGSARSLM